MPIKKLAAALLIGSGLLAGCGGDHFCSKTLNGPAATQPTASADAYPNIQIRQENGGSYVYWDDQLLVELRNNRYMRFRATKEDQKWVGTQYRPADLCWAYSDPKAAGMDVLSTHHENHPEKREFTLRVKGKKPTFDSQIDVSLTGTWMPRERKFKYTFSTSLSCPLESWYENSKAGKAVAGKPVGIEVIDYHIDHVSMPDQYMAKNQTEPLMYDWFVRSLDGVAWQKIPKIHVPFPTRPGKYVTIGDDSRACPIGAYFGFLDKTRGGWITQVIKSPVPVNYGLCWMYFDVHNMLPRAIPPRHNMQDLHLEYELVFEPVSPQRSREIVAAASEINWRGLEEYNLPLLSWDNRFDKLITDLPGEDTGKHYVWWASSYECSPDRTVGYDDKSSVTINRKTPSPMPVAWTTHTWGHTYDGKAVTGRRIRLSAMVKTANCTGQVHVGVAAYSIGDIFYGTSDSHNKDGTVKTDVITWQFSKPLTGTQDWTPLSMEFNVKEQRNILLLEQTGTGQCWFDNVKIEDIGPAK